MVLWHSSFPYRAPAHLRGPHPREASLQGERPAPSSGARNRLPSPVGLAGFGLALGWLSAGFRLDSRAGLDLARLHLDFGFWFSFPRILIGFGLISAGFGLASGWI